MNGSSDVLGQNNTSNHPENVPVNVPVNKTQEKILGLLLENNKFTYDNLAEKLKVNRKTIMRNINDLKGKNIIKRIGSDKSGYWEIIEQKRHLKFSSAFCYSKIIILFCHSITTNCQKHINNCQKLIISTQIEIFNYSAHYGIGNVVLVVVRLQ